MTRPMDELEREVAQKVKDFNEADQRKRQAEAKNVGIGEAGRVDSPEPMTLEGQQEALRIEQEVQAARKEMNDVQRRLTEAKQQQNASR